MGVVWKALDTKLEREVAIKVLPEAFSEDQERLIRFEREAKTLAALNHPSIAAIHGLEESQGIQFLVMELVPGETVAQRLAGGSIPVEETITLCHRITQALEVAHDKGIIHRDLKPGNVMITPDGKAKILDFGLAKALIKEPVSGDPALSPTITSAGTRDGVILGTAAYMSPEQARGKPAGQQSDIWAFGCLFYEMLSGMKAFGGETISDSLAAILRAEPDWNALPEETPSAVRRLLRRCLEKEPARRLHHIGDGRIEIEAAEGESSPELTAFGWATRRARLPWILTSMFALIAIVVVGLSWIIPQKAAPDALHVAVTLPPELDLMSGGKEETICAISPDGERIAFTARRNDTVRLYLRSLDSQQVVEVSDSGDAGHPFFSPDGQWVAFFSRDKLRKVSVRGGTPVVLADAPSNRGGSWGPGDTIVFSPAFATGLFSISAEGGEPRAITTPDASRNERTHRWPDILPGSKAVVFTIGTLDKPSDYEDATIAVADLESGEIRVLIEGGSMARYSPTGHLVYSRERSLLAVPFDEQRLRITGPPTQVLEGVASNRTSGAVHFDLDHEGSLLYVPMGAQAGTRPLGWVDREGRWEEITEVGQMQLAPRISPDGSRMAMCISSGLGDGDIWIYDFNRSTNTRFTFNRSNLAPLWTPDGKRLVYGTTLGGSEGLVWKAVDGSDAGQTIVRDSSEYGAVPQAWLPDRNGIVYMRLGGRGGSDLMTAAVGGEPEPLLAGPGSEGSLTFSPDGKWMAYGSDESGRYEVYVQPFPGPGGKWQLTTEGGKGPIWSRDGKEIFYTNGLRMMVVEVKTNPDFVPSKPRELFRFEFFRTPGPWTDYAVAPDGKRFLMVRRPPDHLQSRHLNLVTDFGAKLPR
jgi:serine/threonine-protein kinase